jgi:membrane associated rhomboid family serine protease
MVSLSLVFINFAIFAAWAIMYQLSSQLGSEAFTELAFRSMYLESPGFMLTTLISAMFMHAGPMHLLMNMLILILLGVPFEDRIGPSAFLKIYFLSGIIGSL